MKKKKKKKKRNKKLSEQDNDELNKLIDQKENIDKKVNSHPPHFGYLFFHRV